MSFFDGIEEKFISAIINSLCDEYEALWFVDAIENKLQIIKTNSAIAIQGSVETALTLTYDESRQWYISRYIVDDDKEHVRIETEFANVFANLRENGSYTVNYKRIKGNSINYNQLVYFRIDEIESDRYFLLGFRDIDRRRAAEIDGVSGIYNRQAFFLRARQILDNNPDKSYSISISDFVDFKGINEKYGSKMGDKILAAYGAFLRGLNVDNMCISGRFGGDQFMQLTEDNLLKERIEGNINLDDILDDSLPKVVTKLGFYRNVNRELPVSIMCDRANLALKTIKHIYGASLAEYNDAISKKIETQRRIEQCMYEALISNQFRVFYQPKHNAATGEIIGAEALIRWIHPEYGFMSPGDFIPLFEKNGFVTEADKFVLETTCKNIKKWQDMGIETVPVSVNASRSDFLSVDMVKLLNNAVEKNDISRDLIHIEITESLMEENTELLIDTLKKLRNEGYQIELDDFGAGYSSINALSEFPIDIVKLDMSFMKQLGDEKRTKVLSSCINLAKNLGYKTVSEGVETKQQQEMLKEYGVDAIQGYYYSKPLSVEEFEKYIQDNM